LGCEPVPLGIVPDDLAQLRDVLRKALAYDAIPFSGGTSKGAGDVSYRAVAELGSPGIVAHGVALKPGKPLCLAAVRLPEPRRPVPVAVLPGFPTSAIFTFHEFIAPVLRQMAGRRDRPAGIVAARLPLRVNSERGRTEYLLVGLVSAAIGHRPSAKQARMPPLRPIAESRWPIAVMRPIRWAKDPAR
jgi:putative molybdopterin biosynthesis protein